MVTLSKKGGLASRRKVLGKLDNKREATEVLFKNIAKAFSEKSSGFVRSISLPRRVGDNAQMVRLEWTEKIEYDTKVKEEKKSKKTIKKEEKKEIKKVIKKGEK